MDLTVYVMPSIGKVQFTYHDFRYGSESPDKFIKLINEVVAAFEAKGIKREDVSISLRYERDYENSVSVYLEFVGARKWTKEEKKEFNDREAAIKDKNMKELKDQYESLKKLFEDKNE